MELFNSSGFGDFQAIAFSFSFCSVSDRSNFLENLVYPGCIIKDLDRLTNFDISSIKS